MNQKEAERELMRMSKKKLEAIFKYCELNLCTFRKPAFRKQGYFDCVYSSKKVNCQICKKLTLKLKGGK